MADADLQHGQDPLAGVVLCCTSLPQHVRTSIADIAVQMGAVHKLDLTSDVTHLIVGSITTPKYRYVAKDRPDIKVLHPNWIEAVRAAWMEGADVDVAELEERHKLGTFFDLKICITGFDNLEQRTAISDTIQAQGAGYMGDLTRQATHLICAAPQGAKYNAAKLWRLQIVSLKWFEDSLRRGMALEESLYDPAMPTEEQGQGAYRTEVKPRTSLGKRTRDDESQTTGESSKRRLRRTASSRLHSQSQDMWQDMSVREGTSDTLTADQWQDESEGGEQGRKPKRPQLEQVQVRTSDVFSMASEAEPDPGLLLSGRHILIRGFPRDRATRLQQYLAPNGAVIVESVSDLENASKHPFFKSRYLLMPHAWEGTPMEPPEVPAGTEVVTEWWVERCMHYKRFFEPSEDVLSRPMWDVEIPALEGLSVCTTGFTGVEYRQTAESLKLMGTAYEEKLVPSVSVLICGSDSVKKEKAYYATKHNITVVSAEWLWACLEQKKKVTYDAFLVKLPAFDPAPSMREPSTSSPAPSAMLESKRQEAGPKRLSTTRKRHVTPLPLQAVKHEKAAAAQKPGPFVYEDDDGGDPLTVATEELPPPLTKPQLSPKRSQPLQELSPNASPPKGSQSQQTSDDTSKAKLGGAPGPAAVSLEANTPPASPKSPQRSPSKEQSAQPAPRPPEELSAELASLIHRHSSRPDSAGSEIPQKRKNRPLGRSASGIGNRTVSASAASDHSGRASPAEANEPSSAAADGFVNFAKEAELPPGTQLGYETEEARQHRSLMEKRMKVNLRDESAGKRVASVGTVRDSFNGAGGEGGAGVGGRVKGRGRTK